MLVLQQQEEYQMGYEKTTIKKMMSQIARGQVYLPAIQRKFVWDVEQIEKLFDSIMLKYPIGTFLFWQVDKDHINEYVFYKFIQEYHERDSKNEVKNRPETGDSLIGVLDGQQRLTALYIALQGSYAYKKPHAHWENDDAFPVRQLYFNLFRNQFGESDGITYEFKFLTENESAYKDTQHCWFPVKEALTWEQSKDYIPYLRENKLIENEVAMDNLQLLWQCIVNDDVINYYEITNQNLDEILDIFVRVNSGGTPLSKSDLLFSTIVANWEDARQKIEDLLKQVNNFGDGFNFNTDFIMRLCLSLIDSPVQFKVSNFRKENVELVKLNWNNIEASLKKTVNLLSEFGLNKETLTTNNIVIPLVYHVYKGGNINGESKNNIKKYLIIGMLKQVFGSSGDSVISNIRDNLRKHNEQTQTYSLKSQNFDFSSFQSLKFGGEFKFKFTREDIDDLFENKKGPYTFLVLSLLYPNIKFSQVHFHQDHIHPYSLFSSQSKHQLGISDAEWDKWKDDRDKLANLQLLEGRENESKNNTPFEKWFFDNIHSRGPAFEEQFTQQNYIPHDTSFSFENFMQFYEKRKQLMKEALKIVLL